MAQGIMSSHKVIGRTFNLWGITPLDPCSVMENANSLKSKLLLIRFFPRCVDMRSVWAIYAHFFLSVVAYSALNLIREVGSVPSLVVYISRRDIYLGIFVGPLLSMTYTIPSLFEF